MKMLFSFLLVLSTLVTSQFARAADEMDSLRYLPVQDAGRTKPYDTFARESLQLIYGSDKYKTENGDKREAIEVILTFMMVPQYWDQQKLVQIAHKGLKDSLKLPADVKYFTPVELLSNDRFPLVMQELSGFRQTKQKFTPYFQAAQRLESQLGLYQMIKQGAAPRVAPPTPEAANLGGGEVEKWQSVAELKGPLQEKFTILVRSFIQTLPKGGLTPDAGTGQGAPPLSQSVRDFIEAAKAQNPSAYPSERSISVEVHEKKLHPFKITWILYLVSALFLAVAWHLGKPGAYKAGWAFAIIAFLMHTYGFGLRMYLTGRPPVSNMYESVVWVSWGALVFAMVFEAMYRRRFILLAGASVGILCLIVADLAPTVLDPSIQPLEPVLRSNMWLTVHVLTITLSYSAFFLAWALGNIGLGFLLRDTNKGMASGGERGRALVMSIYRALQVGVVLLAAGTILGGVWADYSWGRFWGWDPKETWALIALLGYLAILHGRLVGWLQNFGMMASSVVAFNLVIMAWYGVNFVLGAGLHSYGFGAGGVQYVAAFVVLNLIYVGYVAFVRQQKMKSSGAPTDSSGGSSVDKKASAE